jgi:hypothetical protein
VSRPTSGRRSEGIRAGGDVLALGNPTVVSGPFYDAFTVNRASWRTFTISAFDTPNLMGHEPREPAGDVRVGTSTRTAAPTS